MKEGFYFPHFSNARNDEKIIKLRRVMGIEGYGMYFMLLEVLREQESFKLHIDALEDLAYDWHTSKEKLAAVVSNFDLFQVDSSFFFSQKFNQNMQPYLDGKEKKRIGGYKGVLIKKGVVTRKKADAMSNKEIESLYFKTKETSKDSLPNPKGMVEGMVEPNLNDTLKDTLEIPSRVDNQMKVNEIKENEIKENESKLYILLGEASPKKIDINLFKEDTQYTRIIEACQMRYKSVSRDQDTWDEIIECFFAKYDTSTFNDRKHLNISFQNFVRDEYHQPVKQDHTAEFEYTVDNPPPHWTLQTKAREIPEHQEQLFIDWRRKAIQEKEAAQNN